MPCGEGVHGLLLTRLLPHPGVRVKRCPCLQLSSSEDRQKAAWQLHEPGSARPVRRTETVCVLLQGLQLSGGQKQRCASRPADQQLLLLLCSQPSNLCSDLQQPAHEAADQQAQPGRQQIC